MYIPSQGRPAQTGCLCRASCSRAPTQLSFLSAFPHEREALCPPLAFFRLKSQVRKLTYVSIELAVMDVEAHVPS